MSEGRKERKKIYPYTHIIQLMEREVNNIIYIYTLSGYLTMEYVCKDLRVSSPKRKYHKYQISLRYLKEYRALKETFKSLGENIPLEIERTALIGSTGISLSKSLGAIHLRGRPPRPPCTPFTGFPVGNPPAMGRSKVEPLHQYDTDVSRKTLIQWRDTMLDINDMSCAFKDTLQEVLCSLRSLSLWLVSDLSVYPLGLRGLISMARKTRYARALCERHLRLAKHTSVRSLRSLPCRCARPFRPSASFAERRLSGVSPSNDLRCS
jgi:hypothetical protein